MEAVLVGLQSGGKLPVKLTCETSVISEHLQLRYFNQIRVAEDGMTITARHSKIPIDEVQNNGTVEANRNYSQVYRIFIDKHLWYQNTCSLDTPTKEKYQKM